MLFPAVNAAPHVPVRLMRVGKHCARQQQLPSAASAVQEENLVAYKSHSAPLAPAFFIAVSSSPPTINIVVRGTSTWHDALTDLMAHTSPMAHGAALPGTADAYEAWMVAWELGHV